MDKKWNCRHFRFTCRMLAVALIFLVTVFMGCTPYEQALSAETQPAYDEETLIEDLHNEDPSVRFKAVNQLRYIGDDHAVDALIEALSSEDKDLVSAVITALGDIGDENAVEPLVGIFQKGTEGIYFSETAAALGKIRGERATEVLIEAFKNIRGDYNSEKAVREALVAIGEEAVAPLVSILQDKGIHKYTRGSAANVLKNRQQTSYRGADLRSW